MALRQFKAQSKRLLDLMINSIYTHKEIFLRELISNASDALDKLYYRSLTGEGKSLSRESLFIELELNKDARTLTVRDNGIGMTEEELADNLGTIAASGSLAFKKDTEPKEDVSIIGQFGVGFYSSFMVSDKVIVKSRAFGGDAAFRWESAGAQGYSISPCEKEDTGTEITLHLKANTGDESYDEFLDPWRIRELIRRYSDYIRYPIRMEVEKRRVKEGSDPEKPEYETYTEVETLNSMVPLWKRRKSELTDEDYDRFYREKFHGYDAPLRVIHTSSEGAVTFHALLFVPEKAPYDFYTRDFEKGLQLYSSGVLIMDKCPDLLPEHFRFVRGLVDSQDLSLNISREMLQHDRQLRAIAGRIEKKIKSELLDMLKNDREKYERFFESFGRQLKYGVYENFGQNSELLRDLLLFYTSGGDRPATLQEYAGRMKEGQEFIYYAAGGSLEQLRKLPQAELVREKGYEILYCTDEVDEFALHILREFEGNAFKSVSSGDLKLQSDEEKQESDRLREESGDLLGAIKKALGDKVADVRLSSRLKTHPVCLTADGEITLEMEKVINAMPTGEKIKASRVLELNASHPVFEAVKAAEGDEAKLKDYALLLYDQALLMEGLPVEDPLLFSERICSLMAGR